MKLQQLLICALSIIKVPKNQIMDEAVNEFEWRIEQMHFQPKIDCEALYDYMDFGATIFNHENPNKILYRYDPMFQFLAMNVVLHQYSNFDYINALLKELPDYQKYYQKLKKRTVALITQIYEDFAFVAQDTELWLEQPPCFLWRKDEEERCPYENECIFAKDEEDCDYDDELFYFK